MPSKGGKKKGPKAYQLPDIIPIGEVLTDLYKKQWKLGPPIGQGGFGMLYLASSNTSDSAGQDAEYVIKIEPHENGPLFVELHFYQRAAKSDKVDAWKKKNELSHLGVPKFIGSGNHEHKNCRYRFMVMQRFGEDLWKKFNACNKRFSVKTAFTLAVQIIDALEYLHSNEYVHADIKSSNLLLGYGRAKAKQQVYLVDYGLAHRYIPGGKHKEYKEDPKKAHDGTAEFTSRDAHKGVTPSRRGDMEILGYNLVEWLSGSLPWYDKIKDCNYVMQQKIRYMDNISSFIKKCFPKGNHPAELKQYLDYVQKLGYTDKPDYNKIRTLFKKAIVNAGYKDDSKLEFTTVKTPAHSPVISPGRKRKSSSIDDDTDGFSPPKKQKLKTARAVKSPVTPRKKKHQQINNTNSTEKSPMRKYNTRSSDNTDESTPPKPQRVRVSPRTPQRYLHVNAANSTDSPAPKKRCPAKSTANSLATNGTLASGKTMTVEMVPQVTKLSKEPSQESPTLASQLNKTAAVRVRRNRTKAEPASRATQTTPGLKRNARKSK